jgi:type II secretory pathway component PulF
MSVVAQQMTSSPNSLHVSPCLSLRLQNLTNLYLEGALLRMTPRLSKGPSAYNAFNRLPVFPNLANLVEKCVLIRSRTARVIL